jgi:hypothetical protein
MSWRSGVCRRGQVVAVKGSSGLVESVEAILDVKPGGGLSGAGFYVGVNGVLECLGGAE